MQSNPQQISCLAYGQLDHIESPRIEVRCVHADKRNRVVTSHYHCIARKIVGRSIHDRIGVDE